jgi:F-type H+-transporting ATPase subunit gamma
MASIRQIRRRMKSIDNIHEITKAMEMIAAFRFKKAEIRFTRSKFYFFELERLFSSFCNAADKLDHPLFEKRDVKKKMLVLLTADKGLCGSYNTNLHKKATAWFRENSRYEISLFPVGKIGNEYFRRRKVKIVSARPDRSKVDMAFVRELTEELKGLYLKREVDSIEILYTDFRVGGGGQNRTIPFLGLDYLLKEGDSGLVATDYICEPNFEEIFISLLSKFLEGEIYGVLLESLASEYCARMVAMKQATENAEEVLDDLTLLRNKTRQANITRELSEIVSGASVLV